MKRDQQTRHNRLIYVALKTVNTTLCIFGRKSPLKEPYVRPKKSPIVDPNRLLNSPIFDQKRSANKTRLIDVALKTVNTTICKFERESLIKEPYIRSKKLFKWALYSIKRALQKRHIWATVHSALCIFDSIKEPYKRALYSMNRALQKRHIWATVHSALCIFDSIEGAL